MQFLQIEAASILHVLEVSFRALDAAVMNEGNGRIVVIDIEIALEVRENVVMLGIPRSQVVCRRLENVESVEIDRQKLKPFLVDKISVRPVDDAFPLQLALPPRQHSPGFRRVFQGKKAHVEDSALQEDIVAPFECSV